MAHQYPEIRLLVISVDDREDGRDLLVERLGLTVPVIWDADHAIAERFQPQAMPATFVLDAAGTVVYQHVGYDQDTWSDFVGFLDALPPPDHR